MSSPLPPPPTRVLPRASSDPRTLSTLPPPRHASPSTEPRRQSGWQPAQARQHWTEARRSLPGSRLGESESVEQSMSLRELGCPSPGQGVGLPRCPRNCEAHLTSGSTGKRDRSMPFHSQPLFSWGSPSSSLVPPCSGMVRLKGFEVRAQADRWWLPRPLSGGVCARASISAKDRVIGSGDNESQGSGARALPLPQHTLSGWFPRRAWPTSVTSAVTQSRPPARRRGRPARAALGPYATSALLT